MFGKPVMSRFADIAFNCTVLRYVGYYKYLIIDIDFSQLMRISELIYMYFIPTFSVYFICNIFVYSIKLESIS